MKFKYFKFSRLKKKIFYFEFNNFDKLVEFYFQGNVFICDLKGNLFFLFFSVWYKCVQSMYYVFFFGSIYYCVNGYVLY